MLVSVNINNFRSIKNEVELDLNASNDKEHPNFLIESSYCNLLSATAIYGSNATGKSNLVRGIGTLLTLVKFSFQDVSALSQLIIPFLFDNETSKSASEFDINFIHDNIRYQYGFTADKTKIYSEWLYTFPTKKAQTLFTRDWDNETSQYNYKFGRNYKGDKTKLIGITPPTTLFLSVSGSLGQETAKLVYDWFNKLSIIGIEGIPELYTIRALEDNHISKNDVIEFLLSADFNIADFMINKVEFHSNQLPDNMPDPFKKLLEDNLKTGYKYDIDTNHLVNDIKYSLSYNDESSGTKRMFSYAGVVLQALKNGGVVIIDELNNFLHPLLVRYIINLFGNAKTNPKHAQIIFTTHETSILTTDFIRRDQVWFCDKNIESSTELYSLQEFSPRKSDNIERSYLSGRFDAIPLIKGN
jgi:AAA15 family ATPase/GTPase